MGRKAEISRDGGPFRIPVLREMRCGAKDLGNETATVRRLDMLQARLFAGSQGHPQTGARVRS